MKTYYSVKKANWGSDRPATYWFKTLEEAKKFAEQDYTENVVAHTYKKQSTIDEIEEIIASQFAEF